MGEKPTDDIEESPSSTRLVGGVAAAGAAASTSRSALPEPRSTSTSISTPASAPEAAAVADDGPDGEQPVRFAYVCYHCGAHREVDSEGYVSDCSTCGQSLESGRAQMEAVARGEHVPTYDRTSKYYP